MLQKFAKNEDTKPFEIEYFLLVQYADMRHPWSCRILEHLQSCRWCRTQRAALLEGRDQLKTNKVEGQQRFIGFTPLLLKILFGNFLVLAFVLLDEDFKVTHRNSVRAEWLKASFDGKSVTRWKSREVRSRPKKWFGYPAKIDLYHWTMSFGCVLIAAFVYCLRSSGSSDGMLICCAQ